ncbi:MAG: Macrolide export protein MacA [Syntrophorhabdus sp. PtaU1.Bin153]|nr:MAG: Macrolide export protein MacA [Syntrophorhabdus sp. PtaU1.Bin153]
MEENRDATEDIKETLESAGPHKLLSKRTIWLGLVVLAALLVGAAILYASTGNSKVQYRTSEVKQGDLTVTVTATGTLQPVKQVEVGTEVSGTIKTVMVDYNDKVKEGQVLAKLDTTKLEAQILQSEATLKSARAKLLEAEATVAETKSKLNRFRESLELSGGKVPSRTEFDSAEAAFKRAQAQEATARADIAKAEATLKANKSDLAKATIRAPINGIVLERKVEPGQTVAASLQTPLLFKLAEDLRQMELRIFVDEADVGRVTEGQTAIFTVDAFPDKKFPARVKQARFASTTENNVVTYETVLEVGNADMLLRPGMTATAFVTVDGVSNSILVPNAALRFAPPQNKSQKQASGGNTLLASLLSRRPPGSTVQSKQPKQNDTPTVWKVEGENLVRVPVKLGVTDGTMTQVVEGDLAPGTVIATDIVRAQ